MNFLKRQSVGFYLETIVGVIAFVAMILSAVSSSVMGYEISGIGFVVASSIVSVLLIAGGLFLANRKGNKIYIYALFIIPMVLFCINFAIIIMSRTYLIGTLWITALDSTNALAVSAMGSGAASFILFAVAMITCVVGSFFKVCKD